MSNFLVYAQHSKWAVGLLFFICLSLFMSTTTVHAQTFAGAQQSLLDILGGRVTAPQDTSPYQRQPNTRPTAPTGFGSLWLTPKQKTSTQETPEQLRNALTGIHYAPTRNDIYNFVGRAGVWQDRWLNPYNCPAAEGCMVELDDRVSAVHLRYKWAQINPQEGVYNFDHIGEILDEINANGKRATLVVMGGKYTPQWVIDEGAKTFKREVKTFQTELNEGSAQSKLPLPWGGIYANTYGDMMQALADYLKEKPQRYDTLALVKVGGVVVHSGEQRLMPPDAFLSQAELSDPATVERLRVELCEAWAKQHYTEDRLLIASNRFNKKVDAAFPDKLLGMAIVAGSNRFPTVDSNGNCDPDRTNYTVLRMVKQFVNDYGERAVVNPTTLWGPQTTKAAAVQYAEHNSGDSAYQLNRRKVGCPAPGVGCDSGDLQDALRAGYEAGALFMEVHDGNIERHKHILKYANNEMRS